MSCNTSTRLSVIGLQVTLLTILCEAGCVCVCFRVYVGPITVDNKLIKFADDTYLIIPASKNTRSAEVDNIGHWAQINNLKLNRDKSKEITFKDNRKKQNAMPPLSIAGIVRVTSLKILGVTLTNGLSASNHIREIITNCAQTLHALRVLRCHGLPGDAVQTVYRATVVAKLLYACCAWSGFITASDRKRVDASLTFSTAASVVASVHRTYHPSTN